MFDLLGDETNMDAYLGKRQLIESNHGFQEFWLAYPSGPRKTNKQTCLNRWAKLGCANEASHIMAYLEWLKASNDWQKDSGAFIPMPATMLGRQGWSDWEAPVVNKAPDALEIIKAHKGVAPSPEIRARLKELRSGR